MGKELPQGTTVCAYHTRNVHTDCGMWAPIDPIKAQEKCLTQLIYIHALHMVELCDLIKAQEKCFSMHSKYTVHG